MLLVLRDLNEMQSEALARYRVRNYVHLIPDDVDIL